MVFSKDEAGESDSLVAKTSAIVWTVMIVSSRSRTTASVSWSPAAWTAVGQAGPEQRTPNIAPVIQELVNRSGWSSGNSLVIIITGTGERTGESFNGNSGAAPLLRVVFSN